MNKITHIVLTGGPSAGKSTGISTIEQNLTDRNYKVFVIEEVASLLIRSGYAPWVVGNERFQKAILKMEVTQDKFYDDLVGVIDKEIVVLHDRGYLDGNAYIDNETFVRLLSEFGLSRATAMDYYGGVFHLVTAANGAREFYTLENNKARTETPEQAIEIDNKLLECWNGHQHLRVIGNETDFPKKIDRLKSEVFSLMGIPVPIEIEHKFLIEMPNLEVLNENFKLNRINIIQTYLVNNSEIEERVRQREVDGTYTFYHTFKGKASENGLERTEREKRITVNEYLSLLHRADRSLAQISKSRYTFTYKNKYFELDVYPFWSDKAILELEVSSKDETFEIPKEIKVIEEVTHKPEYKNKALAKNHTI